MSTATMARPRDPAPTEEQRRVLVALADPEKRFWTPARVAFDCRTTVATVQGVYERLMAREWSLPAPSAPPLRVVAAPPPSAPPLRVVAAPPPAAPRDDPPVASPPESQPRASPEPSPLRRPTSRVDCPEVAPRGPVLCGFHLPPTDLLAATEEIALARRRVAGDVSARNELVERNLPLALHVARSTMARWPNDADDIMAAAAGGLMRAADKFDPDRGMRFSTYAIPWIKQGITRFLKNDTRLIRIPVYIQEKVGRERSPEYAAAADRVRAFRPVGFAGADLDFEIVSDAADDGPDLDDRAALAAALDGLAPRHREILARRFGLGGRDRQTLLAIGNDLGFTRERARQIETEALNLLRADLAARGITRLEDLL